MGASSVPGVRERTTSRGPRATTHAPTAGTGKTLPRGARSTPRLPAERRLQRRRAAAWRLPAGGVAAVAAGSLFISYPRHDHRNTVTP